MLRKKANGAAGRARLSSALHVESQGTVDRRAFLRNSPEDETFKLPSRHSIARRLFEDWIEAGDR